MTIRIQVDDAERLGESVGRNIDPLGLGCTSVRNVRAVADDMLTGLRPVPEEAGLSKIDEIGVAILAHMGLHPAAVAALAHAAHGIGLEDEHGTVLGEALTEGRTSFKIAFDGISWNGEALRIPVLPETVLAIIPTFDDFDDMPLARVISHPALDPLGIEIWDHEPDKTDPARMFLHLSSMSRPQTRREMEIAWGQACRRRQAA
jgi:hypothetical protein